MVSSNGEKTFVIVVVVNYKVDHADEPQTYTFI